MNKGYYSDLIRYHTDRLIRGRIDVDTGVGLVGPFVRDKDVANGIKRLVYEA